MQLFSTSAGVLARERLTHWSKSSDRSLGHCGAGARDVQVEAEEFVHTGEEMASGWPRGLIASFSYLRGFLEKTDSECLEVHSKRAGGNVHK